MADVNVVVNSPPPPQNVQYTQTQVTQGQPVLMQQPQPVIMQQPQPVFVTTTTTTVVEKPVVVGDRVGWKLDGRPFILLFVFCCIVALVSIVGWAVISYWFFNWIQSWIGMIGAVLGAVGAWCPRARVRNILLFFCCLCMVIGMGLGLLNIILIIVYYIGIGGAFGFVSYGLGFLIAAIIFAAVYIAVYIITFILAFRVRGRSFRWVNQ